MNENHPPPSTEVAQHHEPSLGQRIESEIQKAVIGQHAVVREVLIALLAGGHVLLEGVPGLGKTLLVRALAKTFAGRFGRVQFTPDLMPSDIVGHTMYDVQSGRFESKLGAIFAHLILADEINRAPAKTQSALLEAMQEGHVTIDGESHPLPTPFWVMATQNPVEQEGTYPLPEAELDRFLFKIYIDYPDVKEEVSMVNLVTKQSSATGMSLAGVQVVATASDIETLQTQVAAVFCDESVTEYAVSIVRATRDWPGLVLGAGPRASIGLVRAARALAVLEGRDYVRPDDVKQVALPTLRHRVALAPELELEGQSTDALLSSVLDSIAAPRR